MKDSSDTRGAPEVDYLTRDYRGFREHLLALLDRSGSAWTERSAADTGIIVLEALAYQLDHLAYAGDRVAAEGFLRTAQRRHSVRLHAALGDHRLDRGSSSRGYQHFNVEDGSLTLPTFSQIGTRLDLNQDPEERDVFETTEPVLLDARRNRLTLRKSIAAGSHVLWLGGPKREALDLWALGVRPGTRLALVARDQAEIVVVERTQDSSVLLTEPPSQTFVAGGSDRAALVLGNIAPTRRGRRSEWQLLGHGGVTLQSATPSLYLRRRVALVRELFELLELQRPTWSQHPDLRYAWSSAYRNMNLAVCLLRTTSDAALRGRHADRVLDLLDQAESLLREAMDAIGARTPPHLSSSRYVALPDQQLALPIERPVLWLDDTLTLEVMTLHAGRPRAWAEVEDFLRSGKNDRHFIVEIEDERRAKLRFGDGVHGAQIPPGAPLLARWVTGEPSLGNVGRGALTQGVGPFKERLTPAHPTSNPTASVGYRPPEEIALTPDRIRRELAQPAIPVTRGDFRSLLEAQPEVAEAVVLPPKNRSLRVAIRLTESAEKTDALPRLQRWIDGRRLAGTRVHLATSRPLYVSISALLKIHPEADPRSTLQRCRDALLRLFAPEDGSILGAPRTQGELARVIESTIGVTWSALIRFYRASSDNRALLEEIRPAADQFLSCAALPDRPDNGTIELWIATSYSAQIEVLYVDPDHLPAMDDLHSAVRDALSGPSSKLALVPPHVVTSDIVNKVLSASPLLAKNYSLRLRTLIRDERVVDEIAVDSDEVPVLTNLQLIPSRVEVLP